MEYKQLIEYLLAHAPSCTITYYAEPYELEAAENKDFDGMPPKLEKAFRQVWDLAENWETFKKNPVDLDEKLCEVSDRRLRYLKLFPSMGIDPRFIICPEGF